MATKSTKAFGGGSIATISKKTHRASQGRASKRDIGIALIREDYAKFGKDTGVATRSMLEHRLSVKTYEEAARFGLAWRKGGRPF